MLRCPVTETGAPDVGLPIELTYTNWRGYTYKRKVSPVFLWYGKTPYHKEDGWLVHLYDWDKGDWRDYELASCDFTNIKETDY